MSKGKLEYCKGCRAVTVHLNGYCSCYKEPPSKPKVRETVHYDNSPELIKSMKDLQKIYSDMLKKNEPKTT